MKKISNLRKRLLSKKLLYSMVCCSVFSMGSLVQAADYSSQITGIQGEDSAYGSIMSTENGILHYKFNDASTISVGKIASQNAVTAVPAIYGSKNSNYVIDAANGLILKSDMIAAGSGVGGAGLLITDNSNVTVNGNLNILANGSNSAVGLGVMRSGSGDGGTTHLTVNGNVKMRNDDINNPWAVYSKGQYYKSARWQPVGIELGSSKGSSITINGLVDLAVKGTGVSVDSYYDTNAKINIKGGSILTPESTDKGYYSLAAYGGTINFNTGENGNVPGNNKVNLVGNIISMGDNNAPFWTAGTVNLALTTADSAWKGVIDNTGNGSSTSGAATNQIGTVNLYLQNGASWNHSAVGMVDGINTSDFPDPSNKYYGHYDGISHVTSLTGGSSADKAGVIFQKNKANISIDNYSGNTKVFYEHTGDGTQSSNYAAGDVIVKKADSGSQITLITDNSGIAMDNSSNVSLALNSLANKLTYSAYVSGEKNLSGLVSIAEGLTSSAASLKTGDIVFDATTGKGGYSSVAPGHQEKTAFTTALTGKVDADKEYYAGGVIQDGKYLFTKDSTITVSGAAAVNLNPETDMTINAAGTKLTVNTVNGAGKTLQGMVKDGDKNLTVKADKLDIVVDGGREASGIKVNGGELTINGDTDIELKNISYNSNGISFGDGSGTINVNGDLGIKAAVEGTGFKFAYGINANYYGQVVNANGVTNITLTAPDNGYNAAVNAVYGGEINLGSANINAEKNLAIVASEGLVNINSDNKAKKTTITGDIKNEAGEVSIGLTTADSYFKGAINNISSYSGTAETNLTMNNGALWINEKQSSLDGFAGSEVTKFTGGSGTAAAYIYQKDSNKLNLGNYSGNTVVMYDHSFNSNNEITYGAGDTYINKAAAGSVITASTDNTGIEMSNEDAVFVALKKLAGKLYYTDAKSGKTDLSGKVQIASGLTSSSSSIALKDVVFDKTSGQGAYYGSQTNGNFTTTLTGNKAVDTAYDEANSIMTDGSYKFTMPTTITTADKGIDFAGSKLSIKTVDEDLKIVTSADAADVTGVDFRADNGGQGDIKANTLDVKATTAKNVAKALNMSGTNNTLTVNGNLKTTATGGTEAYGVYSTGDGNTLNVSGALNGNVKSTGKAYGIYTEGTGNEIKVNGKTTLTVSGDVEGAVVYASGAAEKVTLQQVALTASTYALTGDKKLYAVELNKGGSVYINSDNQQLDNTVTGNIKLDGTNQAGEFKMGLTTDKSKFTGLVYNVNNAYDSGLTLQNGAVWTNEASGPIDAGFTGSSLSSLTGGTSTTQGVIYQNDSKDITVDNYSGSLNVYYAHTGDGTDASHFAGGNFKIGKAQADSSINLITDNSGITLTDTGKVASALNNLANKLYYIGATNGETNLSGQVTIASGLTSSAASMLWEKTKFDTNSGQASIDGDLHAMNKFTAQILGKGTDADIYHQMGFTTGDGVYNFMDGAEISIKNNYAVGLFSQADPITLKAGTGKSIDLNMQDASGVKFGVNLNNSTLNIEADALNVTTNNIGTYDVTSLLVNNNAKLNTSGDVNIRYAGKGTALAINSGSDSKVDIKGDLSIKAANEAAEDKATSVIGIHNYGEGAVVKVEGAADILVNRLALDVTGGTVDIAKGSIAINKDGVFSGSDLFNQNRLVLQSGGDIKINGAHDSGADVNLQGNIYTMKNGKLDLGLNNSASVFTGLVQNADDTSTVNMALDNGAWWNVQSYGYKGSDFTTSHITNFTGGSSKDKAGYVYVKDADGVKIDNYSGNTTFVYDHISDGTLYSHYRAGNTIIGSAAAGAIANLMTNNTGINMDSSSDVNYALNALASKLYYTNYVTGEQNLQGTVTIASGLTASSASLKTGDIKFDKETGMGSYGDVVVKPLDQLETKFEAVLTGNKEKDTAFNNANVIQHNGTYLFTKDTVIHATATGTNDVIGAVNLEKGTKIETDANSTLTVNVDTGSDIAEGSKKEVFGIVQNTYGDVTMNVKELNVNVNSPDIRGQAITVSSESMDKKNMTINGNLNMNVVGQEYALGVYLRGSDLTVNGDVTVKGNDEKEPWGITNTSYWGVFSTCGLYAGRQSFGGSQGSDLVVNGNTEMYVKGTGVFANLGGSSVTLNGNTTIMTPEDKDTDYYSLAACNGTVNVNMNQDKTAAADGTVKIVGNMYFSTETGNNLANNINVGLSTKDSYLRGVTDYWGEFAENSSAAKNANFYVSNGATWYNERIGKTEVKAGSVINKFVGGSEGKEGYIVQKDAYDLTINKLSGNTVLVYDHTNAGDKADDYAAGNTVINTADKGSVITVSTSNNGIDVTDKTKVENTLTALAQKVYYVEGVAQGLALSPEPKEAEESNLTGKVQIAEGLTSSSAALQLGDMTWKDNGQGQYVVDSVKKVNDPGHTDPSNPPIDYGASETLMMKGARAAAATSMLSWRANASSMFERMGDLRNGDESGAWAKISGGKYEYEGSGMSYQNSVQGFEAGYDKKLANGWNIGGALEYQTGSASYDLGGKGDNNLFAVSGYGTRLFENGSYLDVVAKLGQVNNDYTVYNEMGKKLSGEYKSMGASVSAEYGKRIEYKDGQFFEPNIQLTYSRLQGKDYTATSDLNNAQMNINQDALSSLIGRLGIKMGSKTDRGMYYTRVGVAHEFAGDTGATYAANDGGAKRTNQSFSDTWCEIGIGGNYSLSKNSYVYGDFSKSFGGDYKKNYKASVGVRWSF